MLANYLKIAWKVLLRNRFFTFVSLFGISLTIGILLVLATLFDQISGTHYPENPDGYSLMVSKINLNDGKGSNYVGNLSYNYIQKYVKQMQSPQNVALFASGAGLTAFVGDKKLELRRSITCENFWEVMKFDFVEGKAYCKTEVEQNAKVVVITRATRDAYFGEGVLATGKYLETYNNRFQVIGVVENVAESQRYLNADLYLPYSETLTGDRNYIGGFLAVLEGGNRSAIGKMKEEYLDVVSRLDAELKKDPIDGSYINMSSHAVSKLEDISYLFSDNSKKPAVGIVIGILGGAMFLFMLLPAVNLVNLNSSRIMERASEIGVRKAFGANSQQLTVQFIIENILITLIGGLIGLGVALIALGLIESTGIIRHAQLGLRFNVFVFAILICLFFGILSGALPALRMSKLQIVNALKGIRS
ncbi:MAG: FtsX-like permease family protein [Bacteroidota bacterium]